jgi:TolB-like protein/tetratricopeptide (TPR) repeat protein
MEVPALESSGGSTLRPNKNRILITSSIIIVVIILAVIAYVSFPDREKERGGSGSTLDKSIAVLPFSDMSQKRDQGYFVEGLSEEILNRLAQLPELLVVGRTSSFQYKGEDLDLKKIGATLGVNYVLEGSVRRQASRVRVTAQLIRTHDGFHLWSQNYDQTMDDIFSVQDDIAESVAQAMEIVLDEGKRDIMRSIGIRNVEAFVAYQKGYELYDLAHSGNVEIMPMLIKANEEFDKTISLAPYFGMAYTLKSDYYAHLVMSADNYQDARTSVENYMITLDGAYDNTPDPLKKALIDFDRTIFSDDWRFLNDKIQRVLTSSGCADPMWFEAAAIFGFGVGTYHTYLAALECHPLSSFYGHRAAFTAIWAGKPEDAIRIANQAIEKSGNSTWTSAMKARAYAAQGNFKMAKAEASKVVFEDNIFGNTAIFIEAASGNLENARKMSKSFIEARSLDHPTLIMAAALGERELANQLAAEIDKLPGGPGKLASHITSCQCGAPFDLEYTPNFNRQLKGSDLPWPPKAPIKYPAKNW